MAETSIMPVIVLDVRMLNHSGIGTYLRNLIPRLVRRLDDFTFHLLGDTRTMLHIGWDSFPNVAMTEFSSKIYSLAEQPAAVLKSPRGADLFWSPHFNFPVFFPGKLLVTVHDVFHLAMPQFVKGVHKRLYAKGIFFALKERADRVICVSRFTADELVRLTGMDQDRTTVIYNGVEESWFQVPVGNRPHPRPYVVYVGNVKPHKNLARLMDAFILVKNRMPHDLLIIGEREGFITTDRESRIRAADLTERIIFTGRLGDDELKRFVAHADALILPSLYEGFGLPPVEAMACGTPAVVSGVAALPEVCGDAALYLDPLDPENIAETILKVIQDAETQERLQARGKAKAAIYSWDSACEQTAKVIEQLIG